MKRQEKYDEAQDYLEAAGRVIKDVSDRESDLFGEFAGENHPLMQTFYLQEIDWASGCELRDIEASYIKKYVDLLATANKVEGNPEKPSIFTLEAKFQEVQ